MPYIDKDDRLSLDPRINDLIIFTNSPGELNYVITRICIGYLNDTKKKYVDYNAVIGVLECAKQEFYRRAVTQYEDIKIKANGDVY